MITNVPLNSRLLRLYQHALYPSISAPPFCNVVDYLHIFSSFEMRRCLSHRKLEWSLDRLLSVEPEEEAHVGQRDHDRASHGGSIDRDVSVFFIVHLLKALTSEFEKHSIVELGGGRGAFLIVACGLLRSGQNLLSIERDPPRANRLTDWATNASTLIDANPWLFESRGAVPVVSQADFARERIPELERLAQNGPCIFYCNNANDVWRYDIDRHGNTTQSLMEDRLRNCHVGSVLLAFDKCFLDDESWDEEVILTRIPLGHITWKTNSDGEVRFYRYKKVINGERVRAVRKRRTRIVQIDFTADLSPVHEV